MPDHRKAPAPPPMQPLGEEEEVVRREPSRAVQLLKRIGLWVLIALLLVFAYVFLLLGEPEEEAKNTAPVAEETIVMPMGALETPGEANAQSLADIFGRPVLSLYDGYTVHKSRVYDTAHGGSYARRVTITYTFEDGTPFTVDTLRPTTAVTLLGGSSYTLDADTIYTIGGVDAARMDSQTTVCVFGSTDEAIYAVTCPVTHADRLEALLKATVLTAPSAD